jgi:ParB/RepB/Spo0J family partition protein
MTDNTGITPRKEKEKRPVSTEVAVGSTDVDAVLDVEATAAAAAEIPGVPGVPAVLPLASLTSHPRNPRTGLGDLTEITASIAAHGVFEPLVVLTRAAYEAAADAAADPLRPEDGTWTHVVVMGHRRAAASRAAGLAEVPAVIRDDLAGAESIAAMIGENFHREGLDPLAEAEAMAELSRCGWSQRRTAAEIGCSQAHVSKRLTLLELRVPARRAVAGGQLSVGQALELHKAVSDADDDIAAEVMDKAVTDIGSGYPAASAVTTAGRDAIRLQTARKSRADLDARGVPVIDTDKRYKMSWPYLSGRDTKAHAKAGCLAASIDYNGRPDYTCTNPAGHPDASPAATARAREIADEKEIRKAAKARDAACAAIAAGQMPAAAELSRILAAALLEGIGHAETLRTACKWLRDGEAAPAGIDHYVWHKQLTAAEDHAGLARYAFACALAADELHVRARHTTWGARHAAHLDRLAAVAGYQPTAWERSRLDETRQVAEARQTLACPECGCAGAPTPASCDVTFDRTAGEPVYKCGWGCKQHKANQLAAPEPGGHRGAGNPVLEDEDLAGLARDLIIAIDRTTAAGSRLPSDVDAAIDAARSAFHHAWRDRSAENTDSVVSAVRELAAAAAPHEAAWTPELRDALAALAAAGHLQPGPGAEGERPGELQLLLDLFRAADPSTAAGSRLLSAGVLDAISAPLEMLAGALDDAESGLDPAAEVAARSAAAQLAAAAAPSEDSWTPQLRDALAALAAAGITAGDAVT